ncbi:MAG: efflux RND transporter permease subunit [Candidatus Tectomicrobia bacterium]|uniref:Efflux RND transporter permease subunit n=1 Tax=Tectimicrobiota bacterium TaxID=2528274 RepID=A0A932HYA2_UNCTE|nr:efflux RND transporter permease subunit [Candidatus Tectomicrobia bacterium]
MSLSQLSIRRPVGTIMLMVCAVVVGFFSLYRLPVDLLPRIIYPRIFVGADWPGADAEVVEEQLTKIIEREMATTEGLVRIYSTSQEGTMRIFLFFDFNRDINLALQDAITKFNVARRNLPDELQAQMQNARIFKSDPAQIPIVEYALASSRLKGPALQTWAKQVLVPQLLVVPGVASVEAFGGLDEEVQVLVDFPRLQGMGLSLSSVLQRMRDENVDVASGRVDTTDREYSSRTAGKLRNAGDLSRLIFPTPDGGRVYLRDFAKVSDGAEEKRLFVWFNGQESVKVIVLKQPDANTVAVVDGIKDRIDFLARYKIVPEGTSLTPVGDQSFFIRTAIQNVLSSAVVGGILAILVVLVFLSSIRRTFIIALSVPIASVATFFVMWALGLTFNIFSLGGLALGVGMLVDNAIVMLENVSRHQAQGGDPIEAAERAGREVESAMLASTLTNVASVVPFLLISGYVSLLFRELILTITVSFICSLFVALTLVAMLSGRLLQLPQRSGIDRWLIFRAFARFIERMNALYRLSLPLVLRWRWGVMAALFVLFGLSFTIFGRLGNELLPETDDGRLSVSVRFSPGTKLETTNAAIHRIHDMLQRDDRVAHVFATSGGRLFGRGMARNSTRGEVEFILKKGQNSFEYLGRLRPQLARLDIADARITAYKTRVRGLRTSNSTHNKPFSLAVRGEDLDALQRASREVLDRLQGIPGLVNLELDQEQRRPEFLVRLDRERASAFGLSVQQVGDTVNTAVDGTVVTYINRQDRRVPVRVKFQETLVRTAQDLERLPLFPSGREPIHLGHIAQVRIGQGSSEITRIDQSRMVEITADLAGRSLGDVSRDVRARLAGLKLPQGYFVLPGEDEQALERSNRELMVLAVLAVFLVYVVMAVQYDSLVNPFVIMFAVPPALSGAVLGLYLTGTSFGATALIGVIMLVGIVVNNAILMVEYIEQIESEGVRRWDAIVSGASIRLRPILMTSVTTIVGLIPLALGWDQGSEMLKPLGVVMLFGLSVSTFVTLFLTPCLYTTAHGGVDVLRHWVGLGGAPVSASPSTTDAPSEPRRG